MLYFLNLFLQVVLALRLVVVRAGVVFWHPVQVAVHVVAFALHPQQPYLFPALEAPPLILLLALLLALILLACIFLLFLGLGVGSGCGFDGAEYFTVLGMGYL